ncbi:ATP-grasp domain-containing protein [Deinococcus yavapaiensis]|uniref:ATP-grasp domain-containing protein n=1 Tax=Deinococcus yavapaiensis KR-236 TaxID=694435 RepID=A0A318S0A1_9DEIO|nr:ATP-grasp domain-containing protein [Deinococcus yavapaiensis]PYE49995.1 ATP-grasp domain-containing protein [Deinococcus yavapaiensis KR-236]
MNVWFNKSFSVTAAQIQALAGTRYVAHASHTDPTHAVMHATPHHFLEPRGLVGEAYITWMQRMCEARNLDVIVAAKERERLADHVDAFAEFGVRVVTPASRAVQQHLERKDEFLTAWDPEILPIPRWTTFQDLASFERGLDELRADGVRLCIKPARGIYASGFRVLSERPDRAAFFGGQLYQMTVTAARELFAEAPFEHMLLMHTLEGTERSIDCVAWQGTLLAAVVRRKEGASQRLEDRPDLMEAARRIAARYGLSGIFNFQTKDQHGTPHMLEINARASGGLYLSMASGVNFTKLMLDAATGEQVRLTTGTVGLTVAEHKAARIVEEPQGVMS